uniref:Uncharacterized protein n=1 Tax=viral metagenome TaxID=1070528 RepID=A0A6C0J524_9ZZZZ
MVTSSPVLIYGFYNGDIKDSPNIGNIKTYNMPLYGDPCDSLSVHEYNRIVFMDYSINRKT